MVRSLHPTRLLILELLKYARSKAQAVSMGRRAGRSPVVRLWVSHHPLPPLLDRARLFVPPAVRMSLPRRPRGRVGTKHRH